MAYRIGQRPTVEGRSPVTPIPRECSWRPPRLATTDRSDRCQGPGRTTPSFRVVVIGAGLGGLCLAQGLRRANVRVDVYERDSSPGFRRQGFRIRVNSDASLALRTCLPPELFDLFLATCGKPERRVSLRTDQLVEIEATEFPRVASEPLDAPRTVNRLTLRQILLTGLADAVHFDQEFTRYRQRDDGTVEAHFTNGHTVTADLLVGADGAGSRLRRQLLPHAQVVDTGFGGVFGFEPLTEEKRAQLPSWAVDGYVVLVGSKSHRLSFGCMDFRHRPVEAAARLCPEARLSDVDDYLTYVFSARVEEFGIDHGKLPELHGVRLGSLVRAALFDWHPQLQNVLAHYSNELTFYRRYQAAAPVDSWPSTNVTLLGDAIHLMPPTGFGTATALRDATLLTRYLAEADRGSLREAVRTYEAEMLEYGFATVREAVRIGEQRHAPAREQNVRLSSVVSTAPTQPTLNKAAPRQRS